MSEDKARILLVDDQPHVLTALRLLLKSNGIAAKQAASPTEMAAALDGESFDLVLLDMNYSRDTTSGKEGLEALEELKRRQGPPAIVMTAWGSIELAVEAMRIGARDFVLKPWDNDDLLEKVRRHARRQERAEAATPVGEEELRRAEEIQRRLLPQEMPASPAFEIGAVCKPAGAVGGDFYDFYRPANGLTAFTLADVSGKGLPAALLTANLQALLRSRLERRQESLPELFAGVNRLFYEATRPENYATLFYAELNEADGIVEWVNCGHNPPAVLRATGGCEPLTATATVVGLFPHLPCEVGRGRLEPGDTLAVFSDGAVEAQVSPDEDVGEERFYGILREALSTELQAAVTQAADEVLRIAEQGDDITVVMVKRRP